MDLFLGTFCVLFGGLLGIAGVGVVALGGYGFIGGIHGGWVYALTIVLFGAALGFVGFFCGRYGWDLVRAGRRRQQ